MDDKQKLIDELLERNRAKAVKKYIPLSEDIDPWAMCPVCGRLLLTDSVKFCENCGQRVDMTTWALEQQGKGEQNNAEENGNVTDNTRCLHSRFFESYRTTRINGYRTISDTRGD